MKNVNSNNLVDLKNGFRFAGMIASLCLVGVLASGCQTSSGEGRTTAPPSPTRQAAMTPAAALAELKAGNARYVAGRPLERDLAAERRATAPGQYPHSVILSCLDSRTSAEIIFDQGLGEVFNARVAGNILNDDILGSMEFACKAAGAKLIAVIGHTSCGAVKGACGGVELGNLTGLLAKIKPAVAQVPAPSSSATTTATRVDAVAQANVKLVMEQIRARSPILAELIRSGQVGLVGGMHDLESGNVVFLK